jgi:hypothetical protein
MYYIQYSNVLYTILYILYFFMILLRVPQFLKIVVKKFLLILINIYFLININKIVIY